MAQARRTRQTRLARPTPLHQMTASRLLHELAQLDEAEAAADELDEYAGQHATLIYWTALSDPVLYDINMAGMWRIGQHCVCQRASRSRHDEGQEVIVLVRFDDGWRTWVPERDLKLDPSGDAA